MHDAWRFVLDRLLPPAFGVPSRVRSRSPGKACRFVLVAARTIGSRPIDVAADVRQNMTEKDPVPVLPVDRRRK